MRSTDVDVADDFESPQIPITPYFTFCVFSIASDLRLRFRNLPDRPMAS